MKVSASSEFELQLSSTRGKTRRQPLSLSSCQCTSFTKQPCFWWRDVDVMCFTASFHDTLCFCQQSFTTWHVSSTVFSCMFTNVQMSITASGQIFHRQTKKNPNLNQNPLGHYGTLKQGIQNIRSQLITFFRSNNFPFFFLYKHIKSRFTH